MRDIAGHAGHEAVLFAEIMWYILDDLDFVLEEMRKSFAGKYFLNLQVFYKGSQKYGNEYFTSLEEFIDYIPFEPVAWSEASREQDSTIETHTVFRVSS